MSKEQLLVYPFYEIRLVEALVKTEWNLQDNKKTKYRVLSMLCLDKPVTTKFPTITEYWHILGRPL